MFMGGYMFNFLLLSNTELRCTYNNIKQEFVGQLTVVVIPYTILLYGITRVPYTCDPVIHLIIDEMW